MIQARNRALLDWYRVNKRDLPWRTSNDPWRILVSEIMLQQTQVSRVVPVYERFVQRFPTPGDLAAASRADVIAAWGDLGHFRRAFNLHLAAVAISSHGWPSPSELQRLPGVGAYTSAAVGSIAFGSQTPAVDTNLRRVLSRWAGRGLEGAELQTIAWEALGQAPASDWNQAIMDLSARLCRPRQPNCGECPVEAWCDDPGVAVHAKRQPRFEGSVRQARATVLKLLATQGSQPVEDLESLTGLEAGRLEEALTALACEGAVRAENGFVRLT